MTEKLPDYSTIEPPDGKPLEEYNHHERRAALLRLIQQAGSPFAITQSRVADRFDVHRSTITRDMDRLRESVDEHLGSDAKLTSRALFESIIEDLLRDEDWRAKKAAWDMVMDWNEWLADLGEQHREPDRSELDVRSRHSEVTYTIVREGDDEPLPTVDDPTAEDGEAADRVDHEALGFTSAPATIEFDEEGDDG